MGTLLVTATKTSTPLDLPEPLPTLSTEHSSKKLGAVQPECHWMLRGHNRNIHPEDLGRQSGSKLWPHTAITWDGSEVLAPGGLPWVVPLWHPGHFLMLAVLTSAHLSSCIWASGESAVLRDEHPLKGECPQLLGQKEGGTHQTVMLGGGSTSRLEGELGALLKLVFRMPSITGWGSAAWPAPGYLCS